MSSLRLWPGRPFPLGAHWDGEPGVNFALFSEHASSVELCLFDAKTHAETQRIALQERSAYVWHGYLPDLTAGQLYGYRVHGPYDPGQGRRFRPEQVLLDPYARAIVHASLPAAGGGVMLGQVVASSCWPGTSSDRRNTATTTPTVRTRRSPGSTGSSTPNARRSCPSCAR